MSPSSLSVPIRRLAPSSTGMIQVVFIEDRYCHLVQRHFGPTIGVAYTYDFEKFYQLENAFLPFNRNGVLFPRKLAGTAMLTRPNDNGHTPLGTSSTVKAPTWSIGVARYVMGTTEGWQSTKIGAGPIPSRLQKAGS